MFDDSTCTQGAFTHFAPNENALLSFKSSCQCGGTLSAIGYCKNANQYPSPSPSLCYFLKPEIRHNPESNGALPNVSRGPLNANGITSRAGLGRPESRRVTSRHSAFLPLCSPPPRALSVAPPRSSVSYGCQPHTRSAGGIDYLKWRRFLPGKDARLPFTLCSCSVHKALWVYSPRSFWFVFLSFFFLFFQNLTAPNKGERRAERLSWSCRDVTVSARGRGLISRDILRRLSL